MGEIRYIIIAKQCEVARKSSILDACRYEMGARNDSENPFPRSATSENDFLDTHLISTIFLAT